MFGRAGHRGLESVAAVLEAHAEPVVFRMPDAAARRARPAPAVIVLQADVHVVWTAHVGGDPGTRDPSPSCERIPTSAPWSQVIVEPGIRCRAGYDPGSRDRSRTRAGPRSGCRSRALGRWGTNVLPASTDFAMRVAASRRRSFVGSTRMWLKYIGRPLQLLTASMCAPCSPSGKCPGSRPRFSSGRRASESVSPAQGAAVRRCCTSHSLPGRRPPPRAWRRAAPPAGAR